MQRLPYHDDRNHLRRDLIDYSTSYFTPAGKRQLNLAHASRVTSVLGSSLAYNLAAAIEWVARNVSDEAADGLAAWLSNSLTNGDEDDLNNDLTAEAAR